MNCKNDFGTEYNYKMNAIIEYICSESEFKVEELNSQ